MEGTMEDQTDVQLVRAAQEFLRNPPAEPFCIWVNTTFPHPPYAVHEPFFSMYAPEDMDAPITVAESPGEPAYMSILRKVSRMDQVDRAHFDKIKAIYCGMTTMMDQVFGELMQTMRETGHYDESAVFLTSDHGNYNGDYGLPEKWFIAFQDAILRVPLGVKLPNQKNHGASDALAQHIDILPTILELVGIEPAWPQFGHSLLPIINGEAESIRDAVFADAGANLTCDKPISIERSAVANFKPECCYYPNKILFENHPEAACLSMMVRTERWKYIWRQQDTDELYDLDADPRERVNLLALERTSEIESVKNQLQSRLLQWQAETGDVLAPPND
jgi:arylsulfatase A-like enzyme